MTRAERVQQLSNIRKMKEARATVALARGNAALAEADSAFHAANKTYVQMETDLPTRLSDHLRAASVLGGSTSRYTAFVLSANADRQALARQRDVTEIAKREAEAAYRAAEALRKIHAKALRQREALEVVIDTLTSAQKRLELRREDDRQTDPRPLSNPAVGGAA